MSALDHIYRKILLTKFFVKGWGKPDNLKRILEFRKTISCRDKCMKLVPPDYPVTIYKESTHKGIRILEGSFKSPFCHHMSGIMPLESETAWFQMVLPENWDAKKKPVCIHLAGTGDHHFWRRRMLLAKPLLAESGIASIILESPYYGRRKPKQQLRSSLHNVSDLFVMGGALVLESLVLLHWCNNMGYGPLGLTGISMGGHMASLAATNWHKPLVLVPCLSWSTASVVFTEGVMSGAIPWKLLKEQYLRETRFGQELSRMIYSPEKELETDAFMMGTEFARNYPANVLQLRAMKRRMRKAQEDLKAEGDGGTFSHLLQSSSISPVLHSTAKFLKSSLSRFFFPSLQQDSFDDAETLDFMAGMMDECTHLANFSTPVDTSLVVIVVAESDAYYPRKTTSIGLTDLWPEAELRYIKSGHISGFLFNQGVFRKAISDGFDKYNLKYPS